MDTSGTLPALKPSHTQNTSLASLQLPALTGTDRMQARNFLA